MHGGDAREEGCTAALVEHAIGRRNHLVGDLFGCVPLRAIGGGDGRDLVFGPAEHLRVVRALHEVRHLRSQTRGTYGGQVRASAEFTQDRRKLHRATGNIRGEGLRLHRGVEAKTVGIGGCVHRIGRGDELVEAVDTGELGPTEFSAALQVRGARGTWRALCLRRIPDPADHRRIEIAEVCGKRAAVTVTEWTTTTEDVELHPVQSETLTDRTRLGREVEAIAGVADQWTCLCKELGETHVARLVRHRTPVVGQTGVVSPTNLLGLVASLLSMSFIWPQVYRVYRNDTVEGLAPLGALQGMSGSILWSTYGLARTDIPLFGSNLLVAVAIGLMSLAMVRHGIIKRSTVLALVTTVIGIGFVTAAVSTTLLGMLAFVVGALSVLPQTFKVLRDPNLQGVSVSSNALLFATSSMWLCYGLVISDALVTLPNFLVIPCSAVIVQRARASQRRTALEVGELANAG